MFPIDNFPAYAASQSGIFQFVKKLPGYHELRAYVIQVQGTIKSTAAAFAFNVTPNDGLAIGGSNDLLTIMNAIFVRLYIKRNGKENAYAIKPLDLGLLHGHQHGFVVGSETLRHGDSIPLTGGTAIPYRIDLTFDFTFSGIETPNKWCGGTEQALIAGDQLGYDTLGTGLTAVVLKNGTALVTVGQIKLGAEIHPTKYPIVGGTMLAQEDQETNETNERVGSSMEFFCYERGSLPAALDAALTNISVKVDDKRDEVLQQTPLQLVAAFARTAKPRDGQQPMCPERSVTPIRWMKCRVTPEERELPVTLQKRAITFLGSSAQRLLFRHRLLAFKETSEICDAVRNLYGVGTKWQDLPVRYPSRDAIIDDVFGTRVIREP